MEEYVCCRELAQQLDEYYIKGDGEKFYEVRNSWLAFTILKAFNSLFNAGMGVNRRKTWGFVFHRPTPGTISFS